MSRAWIAALLLVACSSSTTGGGSGGGGGAGAGTGGVGGAGGNAGSAGGTGSAGSSATGDTWSNYAEQFLVTYCVGCHGAGNAKRDYTTMTDVTRDKAEIRCGVGTTAYPGCPSFPPPRQFPIGTGAKPSDAERDRLVAWLEAGLPQ